MNNQLPLHTLIIGRSGTGKSHLAASAASPDNIQLIALFDSIDNASPYLYPGSEPWRSYEVEEYTRDVVVIPNQEGKLAPSVIPTYLCYNQEGHLIRKIWSFGALNVSNPEGMAQWRAVLPRLPDFVSAINATHFILDSLTLFELLARKRAKANNEGSPAAMRSDKDISSDRQWMYAVTDYVEDVCNIMKSFQFSVTAIGHLVIDTRERSNTIGYEILNLPGKMAQNGPAYFGNVWLTYINQEGNYRVILKGNQNLTTTPIQAKNTVQAQQAEMPNDYATIIAQAPQIRWRKRDSEGG